MEAKKLLLFILITPLLVSCTNAIPEFGDLFSTSSIDIKFFDANGDKIEYILNSPSDVLTVSGVCEDQDISQLEWAIDGGPWELVPSNSDVTGDSDCSEDHSFSFTINAVSNIVNISQGESKVILLRGLLGSFSKPSSEAEITLILPSGSPPLANGASPSSIDEDINTTIVLGYNDSDGDLSTSCDVSNPRNLIFTNSCACNEIGVCSVDVQSDLNFNGSATLDYNVTSANGQDSGLFSATLTVNAVNDAPVVNSHDCSLYATEDSSYSCAIVVSDVESDASSLSIIRDVTDSCDWLGVSEYPFVISGTPTNSDVGNCSLKFKVRDSSNAESDLTEVNITISNVAPVISLSTPTNITEDDPTTVVLTDVQVSSNDEGDVIASGGYLIDTTASSPGCHENGTLNIDSVTGETTFAPASNFFGPCYIKIKHNDGNGGSGSAQVSLTVIGVDDPPVTSDISATMNEDVEETLTLTQGYTDPENDIATSCSISSPSSVSVTTPCACESGVCAVGITGDTNYNGSASFSFSVSNNGGTSAPSLATLTISPVNDPPQLTIAEDLFTDQLHERIISSSNLFATDIDDNDSNILFELVGAPLNGDIINNSVKVNASDSFSLQDIIDGKVKYVHKVSWHRVPDNFSIKVKDISQAYDLESLSTTVYVTINSYCTQYMVASTLSDVGGEGTSLNPYLLCTRSQILDLASKCSYINSDSSSCSAYFKMMDDIDLSSLSGFEGIGFDYVGYKFEGIFDGNNYSLKNLTISNISSSNIGLFRSIGINGKVKNLGVKDFNITGDQMVGVIAGSSSGLIENVWVDGDTNRAVSGNSTVGGLIGRMYGNNATLKKSFFRGNVAGAGNSIGGLVGAAIGPSSTNKVLIESSVSQSGISGASSSSDLGGVVGYMSEGVVRRCQFSGQIFADLNSNRVGGIAGTVYSNSMIKESFSSEFDINGYNNVGGIVGFISQSSIENSFAINGGVSAGNSTLGGFVGKINDSAVNITNSYSSVYFEGSGPAPGGFVGGYAGSPILTGNFWNSESGSDASYDAASGTILDLSGVDKVTNAALTTSSTFWGWDFTNFWGIDEGRRMPFLRNNLMQEFRPVSIENEFRGHFYSVTIDNSGQFILVGQFGEIQVKSESGLIRNSQPNGYKGDFRSVAVGGDGTVVTVGDQGAIFSYDGISWTQQTQANSYSGTFRDVINTGSKFIIVGDAGEVQTSTDGIVWSGSSVSSKNLYGVSYKPGGDYIAVGEGGTILISYDLVTWTPISSSSGFNGDFLSVAYSSNDDQFMVVGTGGQVEVSAVGSVSSWTQVASYGNFSGRFERVRYIDGFVIGGDNGELQHSNNAGASWEKASSGRWYSGTFYDVINDDFGVVVVGQYAEVQTLDMNQSSGSNMYGFDEGFNTQNGVSYPSHDQFSVDSGTTLRAARAELSHYQGKKYFEIVMDIAPASSGTSLYVGFGTESAANNNYVGSENYSFGCPADGSSCLKGGLSQGTIANFNSAGDLVGVAIDFDVTQVWFNVNGTWFPNDPASAGYSYALTGGSNIYPMVNARYSPATVTLLMSEPDLTYLPFGFEPWDSAQ